MPGLHSEARHRRRARRPPADDPARDARAAKAREAKEHQEALLDEGLEESFPASDPLSVKRIT